MFQTEKIFLPNFQKKKQSAVHRVIFASAFFCDFAEKQVSDFSAGFIIRYPAPSPIQLQQAVKF